MRSRGFVFDGSSHAVVEAAVSCGWMMQNFRECLMVSHLVYENFDIINRFQ